MRFSLALCAGLVFCLACCLPAAADVPDWAGTWVGSLSDLPPRKSGRDVSVTMELGAFPTVDDTCAMHRTTYRAGSEVLQIKDYRLCRGTGPRDLFIDEGGGVRLSARLLGGTLYSAFKVGESLLVVRLRLEGEMLREEIVSLQDQPATEGIVNQPVRGVQQKLMRRP